MDNFEVGDILLRKPEWCVGPFNGCEGIKYIIREKINSNGAIVTGHEHKVMLSRFSLYKKGRPDRLDIENLDLTKYTSEQIFELESFLEDELALRQKNKV